MHKICHCGILNAIQINIANTTTTTIKTAKYLSVYARKRSPRLKISHQKLK